jgi:hypothetical protein
MNENKKEQAISLLEDMLVLSLLTDKQDKSLFEGNIQVAESSMTFHIKQLMQILHEAEFK